MGLFDFLKSNKNIITDQGTNVIYENDGKGKLKEKFIKVNGVLHGEYLKYDESGKILSTDYYHNGHIISIEKKQRIDDEKRRIENSKKEKTLNDYKNKICKLIEIDKTIFDVAYGNLIVQMTNATLLDFSRELSDLFIDYFEEDLIKIYLFYKRNYLIHKLIYFKDVEINLNQIFTDYLNSEKINRDKEIRYFGVTDRKIHFLPGTSVSTRNNERIISNVFLELKRINYNHNISTLITSLSLNSFNPIELVLITNQDCELIGLEIDGYITINSTIKSIRDELNNNLMFNYDDKETRVIENKIYQEILSICQQYKFYQGEILFNLENLNVQNLIKISEINNLSPNDLYERGIEKVEYKDYLGAIIEFTKAIEIDENYIDAIIQRGYSKAILKDYKGAIEDFNKTIELDTDSRIYSARGRSKKNLLDFDGALQDYNIAVEKFPEDDSCYFGRGELKYEIKDYLGAIKDYTKCIELKPNRTMSFHKRGDCKLKIEDFKGAIEDYSIVVQNRQEKYGVDRPPSENASKLLASLYHNRGIARSKIKEYDLAIEDLKRALELDPDFEKAKTLIREYQQSLSVNVASEVETEASEYEKEEFEIYLLTEGTEFFYENENGEQLSFIANRLTVECPDFEDIEVELMNMFEDLILTSKGDDYEPHLISDLPEIIDSEFINGVGNLNNEPFTSIEQCVEFINNLSTISFKSLNPKDGGIIKYIE